MIEDNDYLEAPWFDSQNEAEYFMQSMLTADNDYYYGMVFNGNYDLDDDFNITECKDFTCISEAWSEKVK